MAIDPAEWPDSCGKVSIAWKTGLIEGGHTQSASPPPSSRQPYRLDLPSPEVMMPSPFIQAGWTLAVLFGLYGFYCHWEAGRAELVAAFRRRAPHRPDTAATDSARYRTRCHWALLGAGVMAGTSILSAL